MAKFYVRSTDGSDSDNGSTWALAKATIAGALAVAAAGDTIYVSHQHAETQASNMTLSGSGTAANPVKVICGNDGAEPPTALATTATVSTTGGTSISFGLNGTVFYGIQFFAGSTTGGGNIINIAVSQSTTAARYVFDQCVLCLNGGLSNGRLNIGAPTGGSAGGQSVELVGTRLKFSHTSQAVVLNSTFVWRDTATAVDAGGSIPTTLFLTGNGARGYAVIRNVDLSALGSGKNLVAPTAAAPLPMVFRDCKLGSSVAIASAAPAAPAQVPVLVVNADSADTNYRFYRQTYEATEQHETVVVRSGGATDGVTPVSRKIVTTANAKAPHVYYRSEPMAFWNTTVGAAVSLSVPVLTDDVTLTDAEAWIEVAYLGTSGFPLGLSASDRVSDPYLGSGANQASDGSSSWTTTGLGTPVQQTLDVSVTPQEIGLIRVSVCIAKASTTVYYDPKVLATSGRQYMSEAGVVNEGAAGGGTVAHPIIGGSIVRAA